MTCFHSAGQVSHGRPGALLGERSKQLFQSPVIPVSTIFECKSIYSNLKNKKQLFFNNEGHLVQLPVTGCIFLVCVCLCSLKLIGCLPPPQTRHFQSQPGFSAGGSEHGQYSGAQPSHSPYGVSQPQHTSPFASSQPVPANYASGSQLRGSLFVYPSVCMF